MGDTETLRLFVNRVRAIASDCFDLRAVKRLRALADEMDKYTTVSPIALNKQDDTNGETSGA
jgi:hypothetical protein